jgi:hypothetical protein
MAAKKKTTNATKARRFAASPLITADSLKHDLARMLECVPPWALWCTLAGPETAPDEATIAFLTVGQRGKKRNEPPMRHLLYAVSYAIIAELTRYGNSVSTKRNKKAADKGARHYLTLTLRGAKADSTDVSRIVLAAGPNDAINPSDDPRDLRPEGLVRRGADKPSKRSRALALHYAEVQAQAQLGDDDAEVRAYIANLHSLIAFHDDLFGIVPDADEAV